MGLKEALEDRIAVVINGQNGPTVFYEPINERSTGVGEILSRNILSGTFTVRDRASEQIVKLPARKVNDPQHTEL